MLARCGVGGVCAGALRCGGNAVWSLTEPLGVGERPATSRQAEIADERIGRRLDHHQRATKIMINSLQTAHGTKQHCVRTRGRPDVRLEHHGAWGQGETSSCAKSARLAATPPPRVREATLMNADIFAYLIPSFSVF